MQIELIDENQRSDMMILNETENNREPLQNGKTDTFTIETTEDLGKVTSFIHE